MQTLSTGVRKLVTEHQQEIREALRKLRDPKESHATIKDADGTEIVIERLNQPRPAK